jgi:hypothetical protein
VEAFGFQSGPKAFHRGVVVAVGAAAYWLPLLGERSHHDHEL